MSNKKDATIFAKLFSLVLVLILACVIGTQGCGANSSNLRFAQISDVHYSNFEKDTSFKLLSESAQLLDDAVCQVNNTPNVDFIMFTGDMVNLPREEQLLDFIKHANLLCRPWYVVFGNHDISHSGRLDKKLYFDILNGHNPNFNFTTPYYSFCPKKGYKVIGLDTIIDYRMTSQGEVSEEQLKWLKKELDDSKGDVVIIFTHVPLIEPFPSEHHRLINSYEVKLLLKKYDNPIIVCSGHYHATKIFQEHNVLYISTPSLVSYPNAFRIINICPHRNNVLVDVYLKETNLKALQTKAKNKGIGSNMLYGNEADRTNTFELPRKRDRGKL
ncbi:MAG: metallophosphoesterase [Cyanobacteria bacterium RUI128]|nr:metallophosphoesterase [Cyanobacteria bacterium RUI128]